METNRINIVAPCERLRTIADDLAVALEPIETAVAVCPEEQELELGPPDMLVTILLVAVTRPFVDLAFKRLATALLKVEVNVKLTVEVRAGKRHIVRSLQMRSKHLWERILEELKKEILS